MIKEKNIAEILRKKIMVCFLLGGERVDRQKDTDHVFVLCLHSFYIFLYYIESRNPERNHGQSQPMSAFLNAIAQLFKGKQWNSYGTALRFLYIC